MRLPPRLLYRLFPLAGRASRWFEQRFTRSGRLVLGLLITGMLFGIDLRQTLGYQIASLAFALLVTSGLLCAWWRPRIRASRVLPDLVTAHLPMSYFLEFENLGTRVERDLVVQDCLLMPALRYEDFQRQRRRGGQPVNWFDRAIGFPRWVELRRRQRGAEIPLTAVPPLVPGATVRVEIGTTVVRRGWIRFTDSRLLRPDPLGLLRARTILATPAQLLALPRRYPVPQLRFASQRHYQRGGVSLAHAVGDSQEFIALRDYRPGDPRRHIHWRSFARSGRLIVKEYQDEYFDRHALVIDTHCASLEETLFEAVIEVAASIASGPRPRDSILDLIFAGNEIIQLSAGRGLGDPSHALRYLAQTRATDDAGFSQLAMLLHERAATLASVIVVLARWDEARADLLSDLAARGIACASLRIVPEAPAVQLPRREGSHYAFALRSTHLAEDLARMSLPG